MMQGSIFYSFWFCISIVLCAEETFGQNVPTPSPDSDFISSPTDKTVLEGSPVVFKCRMSQPIHTCQWFYMEAGKNFYDSANTPVLVKEFQPTRGSDCSIRLKHAQRVQNGQWMCKGLNIQRRIHIVSKPTHLKIITREEDMPETSSTSEEPQTTVIEENEREVKFAVDEEGHLINTHLSDTVPLQCKVNREIENCSWIAPSGKRISIDNGIEKYNVSSAMSDGECKLMISQIQNFDEGNWRCVVTLSGEQGERLGPIIHVHLLGIGVHHQEISPTPSPSGGKQSLFIPVFAIILILICIIVILALVLYKKRPHLFKRRKEDTESHPPGYIIDNTGASQYKLDPSYSASYLSSPAIIQPSVQQEAAIPNHYTKYLDMSGNQNQPGSYVSFPRSIAPSPNSTPITVDPAQFSTSPVNEYRQKRRAPQPTKGVDNVSYQAYPGNDPYPLYNASHLYEEIDERRQRLERQHSYPIEDTEGYMMPRAQTKNSQESINVCNDISKSDSCQPTLPERNDSAVGPLASYDVPKEVKPSNKDLSRARSVFV